MEIKFSAYRMLYHPNKMDDLLNGSNDLFPVQVELSLTSRCNLTCMWCVDNEFRNNYSGAIGKKLILESLKEMYLGGTRGVVIEGGGEPTLHKDFIKIIKGIKDIGLSVGLITNGVKLNSLKSIGVFDWIRISLDASTKAEYSLLKEVDKFHRVGKNIKSFCDKKNSTKVGVSYIMTTENSEGYRVRNLILDLKNAGVDYIQFKPVTEYDKISIDMPGFLKHLKRDIEDSKFKIYISSFEDDVKGNNGLPCYAHSSTVVIAPNADVFFCCRLRAGYKMENNVIGNLKDSSFSEIWSSDRRKVLKNIVSNGEFCRKSCPECRMNKYNQVIHELKKSINSGDKNFM